MKKRILAGLLAGLMVSSVLPVSSAYAADQDVVAAVKKEVEEQSSGYLPFSVELGKHKNSAIPGTTSNGNVSTQSDDQIEDSAVPSQYGLVNGQTKTISDQENWGSCWTFGATENFERRVEKDVNEEQNFSEEHMLLLCSYLGNLGYKIKTKDAGGNSYFAGGYYAGAYGPIDETECPYDGENDLDSTKLKSVQEKEEEEQLRNIRATDILYFNSTFNENEDGMETNLSDESQMNLKKAIMTYGSVNASMGYYDFSNDASLNDYKFVGDDGAYYVPDCDIADELSVNHQVLVVGWDDDYSKENFAEEAPGDGAWIIQNSWGDDPIGSDERGRRRHLTDQGYNYVSYYDILFSPDNAVIGYENMEEDESVYQSDGAGTFATDDQANTYQINYYANVYKMDGAKSLESVTTFIGDAGVDVTVYVIPYKNTKSSTSLKYSASMFADDSKYKVSDKYTSQFCGYQTIPLNTDQTYTGDVMVVLKVSGVPVQFGKKTYYGTYIGMECRLVMDKTTWYSESISKGQSFYCKSTKNSTLTFTDFSTKVKSSYYKYCGNFTIKLKTKHAHTYELKETLTEPTCKDEGEGTYVCKECGDTKVDAVPVTDTHTWDEGVITTEPSYYAEGVRLCTCEICGAQKEFPVDKVCPTSITSLTNKKSKKVYVTWDKVSGVSKYQIQYCSNKAFVKASTKTIKGASKHSYTLSSLKKGSTYYVRIRTYAKGKYSGWSSVEIVDVIK